MKNQTQSQARRKSNRCKKRPIRFLTICAFILSLILLTKWCAAFAPAENGDGTQPAQSGSTYTSYSETAGRNGQSSNVTAPETGGATSNSDMGTDTQNSEISGKADDWNLILVNPWNSIPTGHKITLTQLINGHSVDERCYLDLQDMMNDCRAAGLTPVICSSYRTQEKQEQLFNNKTNFLVAQGYSKANAIVEAGKEVAVPGTSEHQLGLAVDIVDINNQNLDLYQEKTEVQQWLMVHSHEYGFILRYPSDKSDITGIIYEPWHYRYVGKEAARYIYENSICLEEYLELIA